MTELARFENPQDDVTIRYGLDRPMPTAAFSRMRLWPYFHVTGKGINTTLSRLDAEQLRDRLTEALRYHEEAVRCLSADLDGAQA